MTKPKVVHEWMEKFPDGVTLGFVLGENGDYLVGGELMPSNGPSRELARLAPRVQELEGQCRETNEILTDRNNDLFTERQENTRLRKALEMIAVNAKQGEFEGVFPREAIKEKP